MQPGTRIYRTNLEANDLPTAVNPFTLALVSYRGELVLNVAQRSPDTGVCERFVELLNGFDIPAEISKVYSFHTMRYGE